MKAFRSPHRRFLDELENSDRIYKRIGANATASKWKRIQRKRWDKLRAALSPEHLRLAIRHDDANGFHQSALQDASFDAGYAFGVLAAERAADLTLAERNLVDAVRGVVVQSALVRRSCLRALLAVTEGLVSNGEVVA